MNYIEVTLKPNPCSEELCDVLAALLAPLGFDSFSTETDCLKAYITQNQWEPSALDALIIDLPIDGVSVRWEAGVVEMEDWNQTWEQSQQFEPIIVQHPTDPESICCVHSPAAAADQIPACRYEVVIDPKMSFGSGTHETTSQLLEEILRISSSNCEITNYKLQITGDCQVSDNKYQVSSVGKVLDMGTGTGVLAILAAEVGAEHVRAIEIDDWVADNAKDNVLLNGLASKVTVECGDASLLTEGPTYGLVLANINRNVLLADMARYVSVMLPGATLLMSGFYEEDVPAIRECGEALGLHYEYHRSRNNWVVIRFTH